MLEKIFVIVDYIPVICMVLFATVLLCGFVYRMVTHQPLKGDIPAVGVMNDLPGSVTGMQQNCDVPDTVIGKNQSEGDHNERREMK